MIKQSRHDSLMIDVGFLLFLGTLGVMVVLIMLSGHILLNMSYLFCTIAILVITYFFGLIASLMTNLLFIGVQALIAVYGQFSSSKQIPWSLLFWMVFPIMLSLFLYLMTKNQIRLQKKNSELQNALIKRGAFDAETNLRTMTAYVQDAAVFVETKNRFGLPVTAVVIKIRYFNDLKRMMSQEQLHSLLRLISRTIKKTVRDNDVTYLVDAEDPTWAILLFADSNGAKQAARRIKSALDRVVVTDKGFNSLAITMVTGISEWNDQMKNPYELVDTAVKETQYDVL